MSSAAVRLQRLSRHVVVPSCVASAVDEWELAQLNWDNLRNLADGQYGTKILFATDEWFATADNLLKSGAPIFDPDAFCPQGKVMDGWESRRRRLPGHDWCIIKLGLPGQVLGVEIDTAWFTGNQTPQVSLFAAEIEGDDEWLPCRGDLGVQGTCSTPEEISVADDACAKKVAWFELVPMSRLRPGIPGESVHRFVVPADAAKRRITHLRLNQHPDGGIARLKTFGVVSADFDKDLKDAGVIDLVAAEHGGRGLACSNKHYGEPRQICNPGRGTNMGDGWETARNPNRPPVMEQDSTTGFVKMPGVSDWCILQLGAVAEKVERLVLDTHFFKGNYPESAIVEACYAPSVAANDIQSLSPDQWQTLLPRTRLGPDQEHVFELTNKQLNDIGKVTHVKLSIFPDGGIMRCRVFGKALSPIV